MARLNRWSSSGCAGSAKVFETCWNQSACLAAAARTSATRSSVSRGDFPRIFGRPSAAAANAAQTTGIGYADSADGLIPGQPANTIELKYTLYGDTGLRGSVGFNDFTRLTQHYNQTTGGTWDTGDFSYDGSVNFNDFTLMTRTYNTNVGSQASPAVSGATAASAPTPS